MSDSAPPTPTSAAPHIGVGLSVVVDGTERLDPQTLRSVVRRVEAAGLHGIWVPHNTRLPATAEVGTETRPTLDPLVLLGWVAAASDTIRLGTAVVVLPLDHPYRLAQRLATLDALSGGRLIVGVGSGADGPMSRLYGTSTRHAAGAYTEDLRVLRDLLRGDQVRTNLAGWPQDGLALGSPPHRPGGPPMWFGGGSPSALERTAAIADGWIASGALSLAGFVSRRNHLLHAAAARGRPRHAVTVAKRLYLSIDDDPDRAHVAMRSWFSRTWGDPELARSAGVSGTPDDCAAAITALLDAGADLVILDPVDGLVRQVDRIVDELLPQLPPPAGTSQRSGVHS